DASSATHSRGVATAYRDVGHLLLSVPWAESPRHPQWGGRPFNARMFLPDHTSSVRQDKAAAAYWGVMARARGESTGTAAWFSVSSLGGSVWSGVTGVMGAKPCPTQMK